MPRNSSSQAWRLCHREFCTRSQRKKYAGIHDLLQSPIIPPLWRKWQLLPMFAAVGSQFGGLSWQSFGSLVWEIEPASISPDCLALNASELKIFVRQPTGRIGSRADYFQIVLPVWVPRLH